MKKFILSLVVLFSVVANANCRIPAPNAMPIIVPSGQGCPSGFAQMGRTCAPDYGARYSFVVPTGQGCPNRYTQMGNVCTAEEDACYAYFSGRNGCPSGYAQLIEVCESD